MKNTFSKGFTLVELLIVITILAALAAAVVVVLNPAELLAQARDAQRLSDMTTMRDSINLFVTQIAAPNLCFQAGGCTGQCTIAVPAGSGPFAASAACPQPAVPANLRFIDGTGWISVRFSDMPGGSPIATLPIDPVNAGSFFYAFRGTAVRTFELATRLESIRHRGMMAVDGGNSNNCTGAHVDQGATPAASCYFEVGTNLAL